MLLLLLSAASNALRSPLEIAKPLKKVPLGKGQGGLTFHALEAVRVAVHEGVALSRVHKYRGVPATFLDFLHILLHLLQEPKTVM